MSEIGKYRPADFVGAALNYPLTAADIEFFRVNLQNSNCISYCAIGPRHQIDQAVETILKTICMMGGREGEGVALGHHPSPNKTSLSYFVNGTKKASNE